MSELSPSHIEHLPDEIFLIIFGYFFHHELCFTWTDLNFRLDCIVRSTRSSVYIRSNGDLKKYDDYLRNWGDAVGYLNDLREDRVNFNPEEFYINPIDLRPFVNLRRLSQRRCTGEQCQQISPTHLPYLERLHISDCAVGVSNVNRILFGHDQFSCLTSITGVYLSDIDNEDPTTNPTIRHIEIYTIRGSTISFTSFIKLIKRLPNLIALRSTIDHFEGTLPPSNISTKIRKLSLHLMELTTFDKIEFLVQISPLTRLYLDIGFRGLYFSSIKPHAFVQLARILNSCQTLNHVELQIGYFDNQINIEEIRQLSRWFIPLHIGSRHGFQTSLQTH